MSEALFVLPFSPSLVRPSSIPKRTNIVSYHSTNKGKRGVEWSDRRRSGKVKGAYAPSRASWLRLVSTFLLVFALLAQIPLSITSRVPSASTLPPSTHHSSGLATSSSVVSYDRRVGSPTTWPPLPPSPLPSLAVLLQRYPQEQPSSPPSPPPSSPRQVRPSRRPSR